jgi:hypothetical protein
MTKSRGKKNKKQKTAERKSFSSREKGAHSRGSLSAAMTYINGESFNPLRLDFMAVKHQVENRNFIGYKSGDEKDFITSKWQISCAGFLLISAPQNLSCNKTGR